MNNSFKDLNIGIRFESIIYNSGANIGENVIFRCYGYKFKDRRNIKFQYRINYSSCYNLAFSMATAIPPYHKNISFQHISDLLKKFSKKPSSVRKFSNERN